MKYIVKVTTQFKKDLKLAKKQHKDIDELFYVVEKLSNGEKLETKYRDHQMTNLGSLRNCHVQPDWILLYEYYEDISVLVLQRIGSHSALLK